MPQAIVDRLLLQDHVEDVAARAHVAAKRLGHRAARLATDVAIGFAEQVQGLVERELLAVDLDLDSRAQLLEQPHPGTGADRAEVREDPLFRLRHLVRSELPRLLDGVAVGRRVGIGVQHRRLLVADLRQLQRDEHHVAAALRTGFAHPRQETARWVVLSVLAVKHVGVDLWSGGFLLVVRQLAHHGGELFRLETCHLTPVLRLECLRAFQRVLEGRLDVRVVR